MVKYGFARQSGVTTPAESENEKKKKREGNWLELV